MKRTPTPSDRKILFAISPGDSTPDGVPVVTLMMPDSSFAYMRDGLCHDFDLSKAGIPIKIIVARCRDHAHGYEILQTAAGGNLEDMRSSDFSTDPATKQ